MVADARLGSGLLFTKAAHSQSPLVLVHRNRDDANVARAVVQARWPQTRNIGAVEVMMQTISARKRSVPWDDSYPISPIGGPASEVFRAVSAEGERSVAVRLWCGASSEQLQSGMARVECARHVSHANLAVVEACEPRGNAALWIVSEYVPGPTLEAWSASGRLLPLPAAIDLVRNLSLGVYAAHREGLSHHAIQPCNIVVSPRAPEIVPWLDAKLLDLGLAAWMRSEAPSLMNAHFIAPETLAVMVKGEDPSASIDARANVYSCGALLYFLATGSLPFRSTSLEDLSNAHVAGKLWAPQAHNPEVSSALQTVILSALAMEPGRRYANTGELASALAAAAWRDGFADSYEPSVVGPLPLTARRTERTSMLQPITRRSLRDPAAEALRRKAKQRLLASVPRLRKVSEPEN